MTDTELPKYLLLEIYDIDGTGLLVELRYYNVKELSDCINKGAIELGLTQRVNCTPIIDKKQ
jgi:hypothetical protein